MLEYLKAILFGIVEGITEWLPISSTGHLILLEKFIELNVTEAFYELFQVVIQLGAICAVILLFFQKLNPFSTKKSETQREDTWILWLKVVIAVLPSALLGVLFDDLLDQYLYNYIVVALMLVVYGVAFLLVEKKAGENLKIRDVQQIDYKTALLIGAFQCLSLIPGTSRSGATILGALMLGVGRSAGAEFSFFLAIPTMLGASALKLLKFLLEGNLPTQNELFILLIGCAVSFVVSVLVIRALMDFVRKRSFAPFGIYRIILGAVVLLYFAFAK
ncbi:MAG: undecaprenyl-diphosphate phosphatase [Oscillospiraceae bacterium]|nr:undecaprenyl-diphosphate phosphatase [Oscillospiraceae bacterium]